MLLKIKNPKTTSFSSLGKKYMNKSLNIENRKKKLISITLENYINKRITEQKSVYNLEILKKKRKNEEKILSRISEYSYKFKNQHKEKNLGSRLDFGLKIQKSPKHKQVFIHENKKYLVDIFKKKK